LCSVLWPIVVHLVFIGVPVGQCVDLCGVLWTIVVHPVFIGVAVAQSVDLCVVFYGPLHYTNYRLSNRNPNKHGMNNNGPQNTTQIYRLSTRCPNKHEVNNNCPQNTTHTSTD
jgi:hypothetical protein